jgi:hypothetical protein
VNVEFISLGILFTIGSLIALSLIALSLIALIVPWRHILVGNVRKENFSYLPAGFLSGLLAMNYSLNFFHLYPIVIFIFVSGLTLVYIGTLVVMVRIRWQMRSYWLSTTNKTPIPIADAMIAHERVMLSPPVIIHLRPRRSIVQIRLILLFLGILILIVATGVVSLNNSQSQKPSSLLEWIVDIGIILSCLLVFVGGVWLSPRVRVEATDQTLHVAHFGQWMTMRWKDACFFALVRGDKGEGDLIELSSKTRTLRFTRISAESDLTAFPSMPYERYAQQVDALLRFIAERTQLPLYDMRNHPPL